MTSTRQLSDEERIRWLQLLRTDRIGPVTFHKLMARYGSAGNALAALPELAQRGGGKPMRLYQRSQAEQELAAAAALGASYVAIGEAGYPPLLEHVHGAPPLLCVAGNLELAARPSVGIVGARNASAVGRKFTRMLAERLVDENYLVSSGLARGIDTAAHEAATPSHTAAVVAGGLNYFYPPENADLQRAIAKHGLLITEMAPGMAPKAEHFPRRNRIISGMSRAIIVVEAALQSGSLITARYAAEQGRDVFAVPGSPLDPRASGTNRLIRDGAAIVCSVDETLQMLRDVASMQPPVPRNPDSVAVGQSEPELADDERQRVFSLLSPSPIGLDDLIRESQLPVDVVTAAILELEVAGKVTRNTGGALSLCNS